MTNNSDNEIPTQNIDFGSPLREAREHQKLSVEEIADLLKVPATVIEAIENSDAEQLPPATFTRGYLRGFAKFVEINPDDVLSAFDQLTPKKVDYHPRSTSQGGESRQSPITKTVTYALIIVGIVGVVFAAFQYYNDKAEQMKAGSQARTEQAVSEAGSLDEPAIKAFPLKTSQKINIEQNAHLNDEGELQLDKSYQSIDLTETTGARQAGNGVEQKQALEQAAEAVSTTIPNISKVAFFAKKGAWLQIKDASGKRLHYDMIAKGQWFELEGKGPFKVSLGNARSTTMKINGLNVDMSSHIKPNNIAQFEAQVVQSDNGPVIDIH